MELSKTNIAFKGGNEPKQKNVKGTMAGAAISTIAPLAALPFSLLAKKLMIAQNASLSEDKVEFVNKAVDKTLNEVTNLAKKGVKIFNLDSTNNYMNLFGDKTSDKLLELTNPIYQTHKGKNAFFTSKKIDWIPANSIGINTDKLPLATFHEMGHAFNYNNSAFWKSMQKMRAPLMIIGALIPLIAACTKQEKAPEGQELTKGQKIKNTIRKSSPLLTFATFIPMLLEEGMASLRGNNWAKQVLSPELAKKVSKSNKVAYISYLATAAVTALSTWAVIKVKDKFIDKQMAIKAHQG